MTIQFCLLTVLRECAHDYNSKIRLSSVWHRDFFISHGSYTHANRTARVQKPRWSTVNVASTRHVETRNNNRNIYNRNLIVVVCIYVPVLHLIIARIISHSPTSFHNKYSCLWLMFNVIVQ